MSLWELLDKHWVTVDLFLAVSTAGSLAIVAIAVSAWAERGSKR